MSNAPDRIDDAALTDLKRRLAATKYVPLPAGQGWQRGTDPQYLAQLVDYWRDSYEWRPQEGRIRALPWTQTAAGRAIHQRAETTDSGPAPVVVLLHGWPDSVLRYERVLPLLTDFNVVVPALPGYPFSDAATDADLSAARMAEAVAAMLAELGHARYVVSAGDIGRGVALALAASHGEHVAALHLTDLSYRSSNTAPPPPGPERDFRDAVEQWQRSDGAYLHEQATRPHTLAAALGDSPAGLAAWIVEKLRAWSDCNGDVESVFPRDDLLTWVSAYWLTGTIGTSFLPYVNPSPPVGYLPIPTALSVFPRDTIAPPREYAETLFDLRIWDEQPAGGHFAAWEQPQAYADIVRATVELT